jgi:ribonuclease P protein component
MPRPLAFPKARRLTRTTEFDRVRREGEVVRGALLTLAVLRGQGETKIRAGVITSRKVGRAVVRNRLRRQIREMVRRHQHEVIDGVWLVTIGSARAARAPFADLEDEWLRLARRASILAP